MIYFSDGMSTYEIGAGLIWTTAVLVLLGYLALYLLRSIGLYMLGKRNGVKKAYIAFIPFIWYYVLFKLIKETNIFGFSFGKFAVLFTVICAISAGVPFIVNLFDYIPLIGYYLQGGSLTFGAFGEQSGIFVGENFVNPFDVQWLNIILQVFDYVSGVAGIIAIVLEVFAYVNLFRKFWPEHYILGAVLSAFGLFPIMVFIVRKRKAVIFTEYMRTRYYYGNQYGPNEYSAPQQRINSPESPFDEFSGKTNKPEDPFEEFNDKR